MNLFLLSHELLVLALGLGLLLVDLWLPPVAKRKLGYVAALGVGLILLYSLCCVRLAPEQPVQYAFGQMYVLDGLALFFKRFFLVAALLVLLMSIEFADRIATGIAEFYALILFALSGMLFAASANDFALLFVSLELITVTFYVLASFQRARVASLEAGVKYLILGALSTAFTVFGIQPSEHIDATAASGELLENPVGTGAYQLDSWNRGDSIIMSKFADYWGDAAIADTLVFRWATESASRLLELQSGAADYITNLAAADFATVEADPNLELVPLPAPNILYFGMTNTFEPFDNVDVRRAIGMGIDRQRIVDNFFPEGSEVASHFVPCGVPGGCEGEAWYDFDPEAARQLLADAGYPDGFETTIYYRDVFRDYLPEPGAVAVELQTQLSENLGITAEVEVMESGQFIDDSGNGRLNGIHLLGWTGDYPHPTNFLDYHFSQQQRQFGDPYPEIYEPLAEASSIADPASANALYEQANNAIRDLVPMVPIAHGAAAYAARAGLPGMNNPPFGAPIMRLIDPGKDTLVYVKNAEPISLYCADETDGESLDTCQQVVEALYRFDVDGNVEPALAEECSVSDDGLVWTCNLRQGVKFHDGSDFEAADVIASYGAGIDASNPNHVGNTGSWEYFATLWDGLMNVSE